MSKADSPAVATPVSTFVDDQGREFRYVHVRHPGATTLVVHFTAFFGDWADIKPYRRIYSGYFHRLRMLGDNPEHDYLFVCDEYGSDHNGCYYAGEAGDMYVEQAMLALISNVMKEGGYDASRVVTIGSSMGATGALRLGLLLGVRGIVAICPHIDLDICADKQLRASNIAFLCPDGDPVAKSNFTYTRRVRAALLGAVSLPRLFLQSCVNDTGVHEEQVLTLAAAWEAKGGVVEVDARQSGGHTSDWATKALLLDVINRIFTDTPAPIEMYRTTSPYLGQLVKYPFSWTLRRYAVRVRNRMRLWRAVLVRQ